MADRAGSGAGGFAYHGHREDEMLLDRISNALRTRIAEQLNDTIHGPTARLDAYTSPAGDPGIFGPESVAWRVHAHLPGMLVGGLAALLLQSLHPQAMAAVDQHSVFREDPLGRLRRTASFVVISTFGSAQAFEAAADRVVRIHARVRGDGPDGRPYEASDPALLTWVHVAEVSSFVAAYEKYSRPLDRADLDLYYAETAVIAERLGATGVPKSAAEVEAYLTVIRPELRATEPALDVAPFVRRFGADIAQRVVIRILINSAIGVLPDWACDELGIRRPRLVRELIDRPLTLGIGSVLRWACQPSPIVAAALERIAGLPNANARVPASADGM
jgi:uncharacterized protein (DUF2236 family)